MTAVSRQISVSFILPPTSLLGSTTMYTQSQGSDKSYSVDSCLTLLYAIFNHQPEASLSLMEAPEMP